jgi:DNA-binding HxlR family transcriptional regulator
MLRKLESTVPRLGTDRVLELFMDKWAIKVIHRLSASDQRPGELRRLLRPSQKVLTQTPRNLENSGLVRREVVRIKPLNVRYSLTPLGRTFVRPLNELCEWAVEHEDELNAIARRRAAQKKTPSRLRVARATAGAHVVATIPQ